MTPPPGLVGVPCTEQMSTRVADSLLELRGWLPEGSEFELMRGGERRDIATKRNRMARRVVESEGLAWLFFIDSDTLFRLEDAKRVLGGLSSKYDRRRPDIVSGLVPSRYRSFGPNVGRYDGPVGDDPLRPTDFEGYQEAGNRERLDPRLLVDPDVRLPRAWPADICGMAFVVIARHVLEEMEEPWFAANEVQKGIGEDANFSLRATRFHGFDLVALLHVQLGHATPDWGVTFEYAAAYLNNRWRNGWGEHPGPGRGP